ncbi:hypothetical protein FGIG_08690 [Fasciola gigantica]|uniref:Uncharacterized protein n=1 Tax=Fasciola gigantica TaxID=46835 RepID=A0A504YXS9_FASGI|nr:hypothetical protein FGIG_08690 [Fasciola gigantica]
MQKVLFITGYGAYGRTDRRLRKALRPRWVRIPNSNLVASFHQCSSGDTCVESPVCIERQTDNWTTVNVRTESVASEMDACSILRYYFTMTSTSMASINPLFTSDETCPSKSTGKRKNADEDAKNNKSEQYILVRTATLGYKMQLTSC